MGEETVEKILKNFGLTDTESEVYIFLAKHGVLKCSIIARQMKKDRAQALRILKSLQAKSLVEATLEAPTRYASVPFEQVIDLSIKAKKDEAALMEKTRNELLSYWKKIGKSALEPHVEKFMVIEGDRKIYAKIAQMAKETKNQLSSVLTVPDLLRGGQFGLFDAVLNHPLKSKIQFRFLTEISNKNVKTMKSLLRRTLKKRINIKGRNPELGVRLFPRMIIRDSEEILFFIKSKTVSDESGDLCLWTNCNDLAQAFTGVFEDLWRNSTDIQTKFRQFETGLQATPKTCVIHDAETAQRKYGENIQAAEKEIIMTTSPMGLAEIWKNKQLLNQWERKGVSVAIMVPITSENINIARQLSKHLEIRHVPLGYLATTIIDGKKLFQFKNPSSDQEVELEHKVESTFCTNDSEYVTKTRNVLKDIWKNAPAPPATSLDFTRPTVEPIATLLDGIAPMVRPNGAYQKMIVNVVGKSQTITEREVLNKIINAKKVPAKNWPKDKLRFYCNAGNAVIHPSQTLNLPDILIRAVHENKQSSFGATDRLYIYLWLKTRDGYAYIPVASVSDNTRDVEFQKTLFAGTPAGQNIQVFKKDQLQLRFHGNTFFAGWTKPITLVKSKYILPPACILLEAYSKLNTTATEFTYPSGVKVSVEASGYEAFVTFFHPATHYSGPGTDGTIGRDVIATVHPPS